MIFTMFREASENGQPGPVSMRRVLAAIFAAAAIVLFVLAFKYSSVGWVVFIPGIACLAAVLLLLFFTTWGDVSQILSVIKGVKV
jgi:uncharacterized membrane protein